jgi:hypothetical protein
MFLKNILPQFLIRKSTLPPREWRSQDSPKSRYNNIKVYVEKHNLHTTKRRKVSWIGHTVRRNCFPTDVIEGKIEGGIEVTGRQGRRRKQPVNNLKERKGYCKL